MENFENEANELGSVGAIGLRFVFRDITGIIISSKHFLEGVYGHSDWVLSVISDVTNWVFTLTTEKEPVNLSVFTTADLVDDCIRLSYLTIACVG